MSVTLKRKAISAEAYHLMIDAGILTEDDKVELLNGDIVFMSPVGSKHVAHLGLLTKLFLNLIDDKATILTQSPIGLSDQSEPEPDLLLLNLNESFYNEGLPKPSDVILLVEISDSTLERDKEIKLPIYAKAGVPVYWIVNLVDKKIECYSSPQEDYYKHMEIFAPGDSIVLPVVEKEIAVSTLFL